MRRKGLTDMPRICAVLFPRAGGISLRVNVIDVADNRAFEHGWVFFGDGRQSIGRRADSETFSS
jgi:hypothetical protein